MDLSTEISRASIAEVERRIRPYVRRTPVLDVGGIALKLECLQNAGSFKTRGAFANLTMREIPKAGVVAASGGNHGAAVAYACMSFGVPCAIFVPVVASPAKIARIESYGATLHVGGDFYQEALEASRAYEEQTGAMRVEAFDSIFTLHGPGTLGLELEDQVQLDTLLVAVGGGGLIGGVGCWYGGRVKVVAVEPHGAPTLHDALRAGRPVDAPTGSIANDSLAPKRVGGLTFAAAQRFVDRVVLVTDDDIRAARNELWERARVVAEPGGATAYAALLSGNYVPAPDERVGAIVSGANTVISWG